MGPLWISLYLIYVRDDPLLDTTESVTRYQSSQKVTHIKLYVNQDIKYQSRSVKIKKEKIVRRTAIMKK